MTEVQSLLGHASPAIKLRIYSHWFKTVDSGAVERLSQIILGINLGSDLGNVGTPWETGKKWAIGGHSDGRAEAQNAINA